MAMWREVVAEAIKSIDDKMKTAEKQVRGAIQAANNSPSRMQSRYDSSREEYSMQAAAIGGGLEELRLLKAFLLGLLGGQAIGSDDIGLGSLVRLDYGDGEDEHLLVVPNNGGDEFEINGIRVRTVSADSPLGTALIGHKSGEVVSFKPDRFPINVRIVEIQGG